MRILILAFATITLLISCNKTQKANYEFIEEKTVLLETHDSINNYPHLTQLTNIDGIETLIVYLRNRKLQLYNLKTKKLYHTIPLHYKTLNSFKFINKDSIFLLYYNQYNPEGRIDSANFVMVDFEGKIKKNYYFKNPNIWSLYNRNVNEASGVYPILDGDLISLNHNKIFFNLMPIKRYDIGTEDFIKHQTPTLAFLDITSDSLHINKEIYFPYIKEGIYYPGDFNIINYGISKDKYPLTRFYYTADLFEWNYNTNKIIKHRVKSKLIDSIYPLKKPFFYSDFNIDAFYLGTTYDSYRKLYYSFAMFNPDLYGFNEWTMIVSDEDFNYITECYSPISSFRPIFTEDYIITVNAGEQDNIEVKYYTLTKGKNKTQNLDSIKQRLKKEKIKYLNKTCVYDDSLNTGKYNYYLYKTYLDSIIAGQNYTIASLFSDAGCSGCNESLLQFISNNKEVLNSQNFYVLIGENYDSNKIKELIKSYNIQQLRNLIIDSTGQLRKYAKPGSKNPRLTIVKRNKIIFDSVYENPETSELIKSDIIKSLGL